MTTLTTRVVGVEVNTDVAGCPVTVTALDMGIVTAALARANAPGAARETASTPKLLVPGRANAAALPTERLTVVDAPAASATVETLGVIVGPSGPVSAKSKVSAAPDRLVMVAVNGVTAVPEFGDIVSATPASSTLMLVDTRRGATAREFRAKVAELLPMATFGDVGTATLILKSIDSPGPTHAEVGSIVVLQELLGSELSVMLYSSVTVPVLVTLTVMDVVLPFAPVAEVGVTV